jgi:magnesium chelatase subunit D
MMPNSVYIGQHGHSCPALPPLPRRIYPFSAILAQEKMKLALLLNAVNPAIGGVVVRGEKGVAKSTVARGIRELLPLGADGGMPAFVDFLLGATKDRGIDFEGAIRDGRLRFQPGLLSLAHEGVLYIDEVNLLDAPLVDSLLDAAENGGNVVEREGLGFTGFTHLSRFILIGTMNPEEGELRPQLLDRFGLAVSIGGEADSDAFDAVWREGDAVLKARVALARERLPEVIIPLHLVGFIGEICLRNHVAGYRADIVVARAARAHAAWHGRSDVTADDILAVAPLALPHRMRAVAPQPTCLPYALEGALPPQTPPAGE